MNKVVFVQAYFAPIGKNQVVKVPTGEKKKGLFGNESDVTRDETRWVQTGFSDTLIDTIRLAKDMQQAVDTLNQQGYEVVSVNNINSGAYNYEYKKEAGAAWGYSYGYGYSYTDGLMIVARKV